jgi:hypothetical protein
VEKQHSEQYVAFHSCVMGMQSFVSEQQSGAVSFARFLLDSGRAYFVGKIGETDGSEGGAEVEVLYWHGV